MFSILWLADADTANLIIARLVERSAAEDGIDVADEWVDYIVEAVKSAEQKRYERMLALEQEAESKRQAAHQILLDEAATRTRERNNAYEEKRERGRAVVEQRKERGRERARVKAERDSEWLQKVAERRELEGKDGAATGASGGGVVTKTRAKKIENKVNDNQEENKFTEGDGLQIEKKKRKRFVSRAKGDMREEKKSMKRAEMQVQNTGSQIEVEKKTQKQNHSIPRNGAAEL